MLTQQNVPVFRYCSVKGGCEGPQRFDEKHVGYSGLPAKEGQCKCQGIPVAFADAQGPRTRFEDGVKIATELSSFRVRNGDVRQLQTAIDLAQSKGKESLLINLWQTQRHLDDLLEEASSGFSIATVRLPYGTCNHF